MNVVVVGIGYVGLSNAVLFSRKHNVVLCDVNADRVEAVNKGISPFKDDLIEKFLSENPNIITATVEPTEAYRKADFVIVAVNTDYDESLDGFNTANLDSVIADVNKINPKAILIIRSTVPVGYTQSIKKKLNLTNIVFCPEFLREGKALYDSLNPSRIIVGGSKDVAKSVMNLFCSCVDIKDNATFYMNSNEAESVKLFSNAYLAMRIGFFNELHSYALSKGFDAKNIIKGVSADHRIGNYYNNPSFGYGGYCLPKDTKQLISSFKDIPNDILKSIPKSNITRRKFIVDWIKKNKAQKIGIYRLIAKKDSDNFRNSIMMDIVKDLEDEEKIQISIYEPLLNESIWKKVSLEKDFENFVKSCDLIIANRLDSKIQNLGGKKIFTADLFTTDL
ncbi:nucleotide sugar dehydrogenase [Campylobacter vulpis]|uniref:nucleotide sugar dehydrogenase n=1 Tax=Campylobacter vulpis TaxID=1655500 RepID=UPI001BCF78BB|nr:nucleotide sugar dehydrogenase [Campylobacter vulpis]MBS4236213.1 nucleotide sugar dehydrogenase [Campylobacter vulpis]MBS4252730.1 nucleotide sugar dehydrogenase [Campylobacter vulpis]MBS4269698.1 nucleotide sugar dehydrogenase [Campylobacter vulpis]MBS4407249.1 nucleotide sugar dehydrogenase [Campylobacter vulpis]